MTNLESLRPLQKRIREATGPDRTLDADIAKAFGGRHGPFEHSVGDYVWRQPDRTPPYTTDPDGLGPCVALLRSVLPGYAWKVGTCCVSDDAWVVPDFNCPVHGERLRAEYGEIEWGSIWDTGIDIDRRPSGNVCLALLDAIISALIAQEEAKEKADA